ncbi:MAG: zinc ribbon domain-containing protein, partial [Acidobacteriota bacterium]|nr:zinc ribbon domain-containing protein [Acidobacteriota bacterium]
MPLYEYRCRGCGDRFEILQRLGGGAAGLSCPHCEGHELDKQFSTFATTGVSVAMEAGADRAAPDCGAGVCCGGGACGLDAFD